MVHIHAEGPAFFAWLPKMFGKRVVVTVHGIEKLWRDKKLCAEYSANCKDISFDTIDEYYEKIMKVYQ